MRDVTRFRKIWIWVLICVFVLFLLSSNSGKRSQWNPAERLIVRLAAPFQQLITRTGRFTEAFWLNYFHLVNVRRENRRLRKELDALRMENSRYRELLTTHNRLQQLLQFRETLHRPMVAARVIGWDPTGWFKSIIIDRGVRTGMKIDMPVVNAQGVVGRIVSVAAGYSKVLLIIDQNSAVDCLVERSRDRGMVKGLSSETCKLAYVVKSSDVMAGDMVVTSGLGGVFPKGLPVGYVIRVGDTASGLFKDIDVRPVVDFSRLEEVLVILEKPES